MEDKKLKARLINVLRREFLYSKQYKEALKKAERLKGYYQCASCSKSFPKINVNVDHIEPVVELTGFVDFDTYIKRLFFGALQVLCKKCHQLKTGIENKSRKPTPFKEYGEFALYKKKKPKKS